MGATNELTCPVRNMQKLLLLHQKAKSSLETPLFNLHYHQLVKLVKLLLSKLKINIKRFSTRSGGATALAKAGVPRHLIQILGRWKSSAYKTYVRLAPQDIASITKKICPK